MIENKKIYDVIIIGAGPAGLTASIYLSRSDFDILVIEKEVPGGKMVKTYEIENYPGYKKISGVDLSMNFYEQSLKYKTKFAFEEVISFTKNKNIFSVVTKNKKSYFSKTIIIASGTKERRIQAKNEEIFRNKGVSYCAVCDGALYKNKNVAVIGGGYSAVEEALFLTKFVNKVFLIHRRKEFRVPDSILKNAKKNSKIEFILDSVVTSINGDDVVKSINIENVLNKKITELKISAIFPYIGAIPETYFINDNLKLKIDEGYIVKDNKCKTNVDGLFVAGDVSNTSLRQITTATSDGAIAAQHVIAYINNV